MRKSGELQKQVLALLEEGPKRGAELAPLLQTNVGNVSAVLSHLKKKKRVTNEAGRWSIVAVQSHVKRPRAAAARKTKATAPVAAPSMARSIRC